MSDIVILWGGKAADTGKPMHHLLRRFREITTVRIDADLTCPTV